MAFINSIPPGEREGDKQGAASLQAQSECQKVTFKVSISPLNSTHCRLGGAAEMLAIGTGIVSSDAVPLSCHLSFV